MKLYIDLFWALYRIVGSGWFRHTHIDTFFIVAMYKMHMHLYT